MPYNRLRWPGKSYDMSWPPAKHRYTSFPKTGVPVGVLTDTIRNQWMHLAPASRQPEDSLGPLGEDSSPT